MGHRAKKESTFSYNEYGARPSVDIRYHLSGSDTVSTAFNIAPSKRARVEQVTDVDDDFYPDAGSSVHQPAPEELAAIADTLSANPNSDDEVYEYQIPGESTKRPRYVNSDDPMKIWRQHRDTVLDHLLRLDGLGPDTARPSCFYCKATYEKEKLRVFRCQDCGVFLQCLSCLEERHKLHPLHVIQEWTGEFWIRAALHRIDLKEDSPQSLRMQYQLGHQGLPCPLPANPHRLVVLDVNGVFTLDVRACSCSRSLSRNLVGQLISTGWYPATMLEMGTCTTLRCLELYRQLNVVGNMNAHDFVGSLERDRYKAFGRSARQYASLKRVKRAGLAHQEQGWNSPAGEESKVDAGAVAVKCWCCPRPDFNLPANWENCKSSDEFLYALMLALDANFRLKNRIRANERQDAGLGMANSLSYTRGVGRTDGEGIERTWAILNTMSYATKEMAQGNRHDTLEDKVDHINFEKNVGQGTTLPRKLVIAVAERDKQIAEFVEIDSSLDASVRRDWQRQVHEWERDKTNPNPYVVAGGKNAGPTEAQVAAALKAAEVQEAREGNGEFVDGRTTAAAFVKGLLQLEDVKYARVYVLTTSRRRIKNELKSTTLTADRASQIDELRASFFKKVNAIRKQQEVFMPGVPALRRAEEELRDADRPPPNAEDTKLWLPSDLRPTELRACKRGLVTVEGRLREAQCGDALVRIRSLLYQKTHLIHHRNTNVTGQRASTRSGTLIGRVTDQISREVTKYRQAWRALQTLMGADYAPEYRELQDGDLSVSVERESDAGARLRLGKVGMTRRARNEPSNASGESRAVSWIWWATRAGDEETGLHDAVRVRWAKTRARRDRWIEEVRLLREEMKRVLRSLQSVQREWARRIDSGRLVDSELAAGLAAYASVDGGTFCG
ncbi:CxC2 domain-containing protein [Mycena kentingensis (nom. inval.)]|nr:CxC2 domain-containing protein [Mycena kentingensis (nom. inval.)]